MPEPTRHWTDPREDTATFRRACGELFSFLHDEYGFSLSEFHELTWGVSLEVSNTFATVRVAWDQRDATIDLHVIRRPSPYSRSYDPADRWTLAELLRGSGSTMAVGGRSVTTINDLLNMLPAYADALHATGDAVLRGDFSKRSRDHARRAVE